MVLQVLRHARSEDEVTVGANAGLDLKSKNWLGVNGSGSIQSTGIWVNRRLLRCPMTSDIAVSCDFLCSCCFIKAGGSALWSYFLCLWPGTVGLCLALGLYSENRHTFYTIKTINFIRSLGVHSVVLEKYLLYVTTQLTWRLSHFGLDVTSILLSCLLILCSWYYAVVVGPQVCPWGWCLFVHAVNCAGNVR